MLVHSHEALFLKRMFVQQPGPFGHCVTWNKRLPLQRGLIKPGGTTRKQDQHRERYVFWIDCRHIVNSVPGHSGPDAWRGTVAMSGRLVD
jgi:hypothetical protein